MGGKGVHIDLFVLRHRHVEFLRLAYVTVVVFIVLACSD